MTLNKTRIAVAIAGLAVAGMTASQNAAAYAYAYSYADIYNFVITTGGSATLTGGLVNGSGAAIQGVTTTATACGAAAFGAAACNIPVALRNAVIANDTFSRQEGAALSFARADGAVPSVGDRAQDLAESKSSDKVSWKATEQYDLTGQIVVTGGGANDTVTFDFDALIDMIARLNGGAILGSQAQATLDFTIGLTNATGTPAYSFSWSPDGTGARAITGGSITADPFNLNLSLSQLNADGDTTPAAGEEGPDSFSAVTVDLADGTYNLSVSKKSSTNANFNQVPEPASVALLGIGLAGIGAARARRKARA
jgi:hypothetical protein